MSQTDIDLSLVSPEDVFKHLDCDANGLTTEEAARCRAKLERRIPNKQQHLMQHSF
ncbi:hypothetical protein K438DRAFT_1816713 [Mycena galopus ATCC 62051]|nr:hypothetical protein K438DRAFT_1816713 [Mycena galopus ATCC 62051]